MFKRLYLLINFIFYIPCLIGQGENVIFDFNGVLMGTDRSTTLQYLGLGDIVRCMVCLKKSPTEIYPYMTIRFFNILNLIAQNNNLDEQKSQPAYDEEGNPLPYLMRAWLDGSMTCDEIKKYIFQSIAIHPEWFECVAEKRIISNLMKTIFTPKQFAKTRKIHQNCLAFIKTCKKYGHKVYALSNWDKESFVLLQEKYPEVFTLFDGIIISGEVNELKPSSAIYITLLNRFNLEPDSCWFIDDQEENIVAAIELGIHGIICPSTGLITKKPDFQLVRQTIKEQIKLQHQNEMNGKTTELTPL